MNEQRLKLGSDAHAGTGGTSERNGGLGFRPAFLDGSTMTIYPSRLANGTLAPFHILDGLPDEVVITRDANGRVIEAKPSLVAGFERRGFFYTRAAAARALSEWFTPSWEQD